MHPVFAGLAKELRAEGLTVEVVPGWKERGRPYTFDPKGVMNHHTASAASSGDHPALGIVTHGRLDLPGPLANFVLARSGTVVIVAAGYCNHAGAGGPFRFLGVNAGNRNALAIEAENDGRGEKWPEKQKDAYAVLNGVLLKRLGKSKWWSIGHKEYTPRKIDPSFSMKAFRKLIGQVLKPARYVLKARRVFKNRKWARKVRDSLRAKGFTAWLRKK